MKVRHIKSGKVYSVFSDNAIDCTNSESDKRMVVYHNSEGTIFVREAKEFSEKFKPVVESNLWREDEVS